MKLIISIFILALFMISLPSCSSDEGTGPVVNDPFPSGYNSQESSESMTLSTLSYVCENDTAYMKDSLIIQLSIVNYSTQGKWKLAWGPCLSPDGGNMMFVARDTTTTPDRYAIAIRGTDWCFPFNWKEDLGAIDFTAYPFSSDPGDSISYGALQGVNRLLEMTDPVTHHTLANYLNGITTSPNQIYITGHSLGGMLATVLSAWFLDNGYGSKFKLKTYTFAAPTSGNQEFVDHFTSVFTAAGAECHRVENPKDIVHYFNGSIQQIVVEQIPTTIPLSVDLVLTAMAAYFIKYNMYYKHVGEKHALGDPAAPVCNFTPGSLDNYECWVGYEHTTSTYLSLLNAPSVNVNNTPCKWQNP